MKALLKLVVFMAAGYFIGKLAGLEHLETEAWYGPVTAALLAVGLYSSTFGIVAEEVKEHVRLVVGAVTVGVLAKALIIGGVLTLIFHDPLFWVLGIAVAQIDPLSVAALNSKKSGMSRKARSILGAWSSFDDPMTVLLGLYVPMLIVSPQAGASPIVTGGIMGYGLSLGLNLLFAGVTFVVWRKARNSVTNTAAVLLIGYTLLAFSFATAVMWLLMLGLALIGLFLRPNHIERGVERAVSLALAAATMLLGVLLLHGVNVVAGITLGVAAYFAQTLVAIPLTRKLPQADRLHLMFAQQNGITAIILSLLFEPAYPGTVAIVAPAIIVVNLLHAVVNKGLSARIAAMKRGVQ